MKAPSLIAFAGMLACAFARAGNCPTGVPQGLRTAPVADRVYTQGLWLAIAQVEGKEPAATVLARTTDAWKAAGFDVKRNTAAGWEIVAAKGEGCLVTLQLTERHGSFGYLARSSDGKGAVPTAAELGVKLPPDARLASSVASDDDGRKSLVLNLSSNKSLAQLSDFFQRELVAADWKATRAHKVTDGRTRIESLFVSAQRNRQRVEIVIWPERGSQIVMTISEAI